MYFLMNKMCCVFLLHVISNAVTYCFLSATRLISTQCNNQTIFSMMTVIYIPKVITILSRLFVVHPNTTLFAMSQFVNTLYILVMLCVSMPVNAVYCNILCINFEWKHSKHVFKILIMQMPCGGRTKDKSDQMAESDSQVKGEPGH